MPSPKPAKILNQTWHSLEQVRPAYHLLLRLRIDFPDLTSGELAERFQQKIQKPMTAVNVRKTLPRAQAKFADLLVCEVATMLEPADIDGLRTVAHRTGAVGSPQVLPFGSFSLASQPLMTLKGSEVARR